MSSHPAVIVVIALAITSFIVLILGHILEPFLNLMDSTDTTITPILSAPRELMVQFFRWYLWPKGVLLIIFIVLSLTMLMEYQKAKYKEA